MTFDIDIYVFNFKFSPTESYADSSFFYKEVLEQGYILSFDKVKTSYIHEKINKCNILIVLVGKSMLSATGVAKEISFANENNVPVFGIYVDGANENSSLPTGLQRNRTIKWSWDSIANAIDQCMNEGKNI